MEIGKENTDNYLIMHHLNKMMQAEVVTITKKTIIAGGI